MLLPLPNPIIKNINVQHKMDKKYIYKPYLTGSSSNSILYIREYLLYRIKKKLNLILQWYLRSAIMTPILKCCVLALASMTWHFFFP